MNKITVSKYGIIAEVKGKFFAISKNMGIQITSNSHGYHVSSSAGPLFAFNLFDTQINGQFFKDGEKAIKYILKRQNSIF